MRSPLAELLSLAGPTIAQMASYTLMQFIDTWMLAHYGNNAADGLAPTAASNAGIFSFSLISLGFGVLLIVNTLASQCYGKKEYAACGRYLWQGIWFALLYSVLMLPIIPFSLRIFQAFGHGPQLAGMESSYLKIMLACTVLKLVQTTFGQFMLAIDRPKAVMISTIVGVSSNAVAAYILIYGKFGFKPMGVVGSALGQNIGVLIEMLLLVALCLASSARKKYELRHFQFRWREFKILLGVGVPVGLQFAADVMAWTLFCVWVMAPFGELAMAANSYVFRYYSVSFMPAYGISSAVTALVGRYIGRGKPDIAVARANLGFKITLLYMFTCGVFFFFARHQLLHLFTDNPEILRIGSQLLIVAALYQFLDALYIIYNGALRGAGDTFVPALVTIVLCYGMTVMGGRYVARHFPQLGPTGPWSASLVYGLLLGGFMSYRFSRGGWKKIKLV